MAVFGEGNEISIKKKQILLKLISIAVAVDQSVTEQELLKTCQLTKKTEDLPDIDADDLMSMAPGDIDPEKTIKQSLNSFNEEERKDAFVIILRICYQDQEISVGENKFLGVLEESWELSEAFVKEKFEEIKDDVQRGSPSGGVEATPRSQSSTKKQSSKKDDNFFSKKSTFKKLGRHFKKISNENSSKSVSCGCNKVKCENNQCSCHNNDERCGPQCSCQDCANPNGTKLETIKGLAAFQILNNITYKQYEAFFIENGPDSDNLSDKFYRYSKSLVGESTSSRKGSKAIIDKLEELNSSNWSCGCIIVLVILVSLPLFTYLGDESSTALCDEIESTETVQEIQKTLKSHDENVSVDGVWGPNTRRTIESACSDDLADRKESEFN